MKNFKFAVAVFAVAAGLATGVQAGEMPAYRGQTIDLGNVNGVAYYTVEKDGYRVVATLADPESNAVRFEAVLAAGQKVVLSSPGARGGVAERIEISRNADRVDVQKMPVTN